MIKYDDYKRYDTDNKSELFAYDGVLIGEKKYIFDTFSFVDELKDLSALLYINDSVTFADVLNGFVATVINDSLTFTDILSLQCLARLEDEVRIYDEILNILAELSVEDTFKLTEQIQAYAQMLVADGVTFDDKFDIKALATVTDKVELAELVTLFITSWLYDEFTVTDKDAKTAATDFYIGVEGNLDKRWDWLMPFNMVYSRNESTVDFMPATESNNVNISGIDGTLLTDTTYTNRQFNIVAYTMMGLTPAQKEEVRRNITKLLDKTKKSTQVLTFQKNSLSFDVKYDGKVVQTEGDSFVKVEIPFSASPYGRSQFIETLEGGGQITNDGDTDLGVKCIITGGCVNPNFMIGDTEFYWSGTVPTNSELVIDNESKTAYLIDEYGTQTQAMAQLTKGYRFKTIPRDTATVLRTLNTSTSTRITTTYSPRYLWKEVD